MILGITGGTGSGKTTLLDLIEEHGGLVIDCDRLYHQLLETDQELLYSIEARFPGVVKNGKLNRKKLGSIVFSEKQALLDLNEITHRAVYEAVVQQLTPEPRLAAVDAIGLFEGGVDKLCKLTVAVNAPWEARLARLIARDGISEEYALSRMNAQPSNAAFSARCDYTLDNDGTEAEFRQKCLAFIRNLDIIK